MKITPAASPLGNAVATLLAGLLCTGLTAPLARAQPAVSGDEGAEVQTRGPVHEAFAGVVSYNPEPGIVVKTPPPAAIDEVPPEEKPEGDDVAWIPGYWAWDDERNDYLWISGTWRVPPPGRAWMAGYWRDAGDGYQWISGYWADAAAEDVAYLPAPPPTLEIGANVDAPSDDYGWTPGCWIWCDGRYAWRAGYWSEGRADWVWVPAYYAWTPRGYIYIDGFWDYPVERRGVLFAPVWYSSRSHMRRGYVYTPSIVISLSFFNDCLFLRPSYHHYYFGDYYDSRYDGEGFYASYSFQSGRHGYDPFYSHNRWEHRDDRDWANRYRASYGYRRDHEAARPPRTWSAQVTVSTRSATGGRALIVVASPIQQLARSKDNPGHFQPVPQADRRQLVQQGREVQQSRVQRQTVEAKAAIVPGRGAAGGAVEPVRVTVTRSPIMGRPSGQPGRNAAPPQAPRAETQVQPGTAAPGRPSNGDRRGPSPESRQPEPDRGAAVKTREDPRTTTTEKSRAEDRLRQDAEEHARTTMTKARDDQRKAEEAQAGAQQDAAKRNRDAAEPVRQKAGEPAGAPQPQAEDRRNAVEQAREEAQPRGRDTPAKTPRDPGERTDPAATGPDAPRRAPESPVRQPVAPRRAPEAAAKPKPVPPQDKPAPEDDDDSKKDKGKPRDR